MAIQDIHTHHKREEAIINSFPESFVPENGYFYSVGIHPWHVTRDHENAWELFNRNSRHEQVLAIGEIGIDKLKGPEIELQTILFKMQAKLAEELNKPVIIHSVRSSNELIKLKQELKPNAPWIIHGFRGNKNITDQLLSVGFYLSYGEKYQVESLQNTPIDRIFIETDESKKNIFQIYNQVAQTLSLPVDCLREQINNNIKEVFFHR